MEKEERKLVTIRTINKLVPIDGKDLICLAIIDGWSVIVKKTEFKAGDLCLFFEIDSFIKVEDTRFDFLAKTKVNYNGVEGYRIKTMKMSGCLSQGLALPLHMFHELPDTEFVNTSCDYAEKLNIVKYDVDFQTNSNGSNGGQSISSFPSFIPKTDQTRIQNVTHYFETYEDEEFEETLKLDGSSMTCYKLKKDITIWNKIVAFFTGTKAKNYHFGVCSRNQELRTKQENSSSNFLKAAELYKIESNLPHGFSVQGELIAPNIQANHEKVTNIQYRIFNVFDINNQEYLLPEEARKFCEVYKLNYVPVVGTNIKIFKVCKTLDELLTRVDGESINKGTISEGRVYKSTRNPKLTFKVINNRYLLKCEK